MFMQTLLECFNKVCGCGRSGCCKNTYPGEFPGLLRLGECTEHNEHDTHSKSKKFLSLLWYHLITLSALASTLGGMVRPICLAAFRLITNSNFFGCSTGRSAGLAPLRILST